MEHSTGGAPMPSLIHVGRSALLEVLGLAERCSPNPRRNTSKEFFETLWSGNKADTCFRFCFRLVSGCFQCVSALFPLVETERKHVLNFEASIFNESVGYGR